MPDERRSGARLTLTVDWPEITLDRLSRITSLWTSLVQTVSAEATGKKQAVKWVVRTVKFGSPLTIESVGESFGAPVSPAIIQRAAEAIVHGIEHLESRPDGPEFFSPYSLGLAKTLAMQTDALKQRRIAVSNGSAKPVDLSLRTAATVDAILGPTVESFGSIEGQIEGIITHGKPRFYVWDSLTGRQVRCLFSSDTIPLDDILKGYEKRVSVSGIIQSRAITGEDFTIQASEFRVFEPDERLMTTDEILNAWGRHA